MTRVISFALKAAIAVVGSLILLQIEIGWYGFFVNLILINLLVLLSFHLGYLEDE